MLSDDAEATERFQATSPDMVKRLWEWSIIQAEAMAETGIVTGLLAAPLLGVVTEEDADSAVVVDMARNILGNPSAVDDEDDAPSVPAALEAGAAQEPLPGDSLRVTGVDHVGGGPVGETENGDQKLGRGEDESVSSASSDSASSDSASSDPASTGTQPSGADGAWTTPAGGTAASRICMA